MVTAADTPTKTVATPAKSAVAKAKRSPKAAKSSKVGKDGKIRRKKTKREPKLDAEGNVIKRSNGGLSKPMRLSDELAAFLGVREESRCQVVARIWAHIKANNLQNPADKREIFLDAAMQQVFKVDKLTMFSVNKFLSPHLTSIV